MKCNCCFLLLLVWLFAACKDSSNAVGDTASKEQVNSYVVPKPGTVVATMEQAIANDDLNKRKFKVSVIADEHSDVGIYKVKLEYGFNINETTIELPEWTEGVVLKPLLEKAEEQNYFKIGFGAGDGKFRELYDVKADQSGTVSLKKTTGYYSTPANN